MQLYDSAVENYFLQAFGRNQRRIVCECERSDEPTMVQVLHLSNGNTAEREAESPRQPARQAGETAPPGDVERRPCRRDLSGLPGALSDRRRAQPPARAPAARRRPSEREIVEDVFWGLLSSREFLFNH